MSELVFPAAALALLVLVLVPAATLVVKLALRAFATGRLRAGSDFRYALLVAPVLGPTGWIVSAATHHAEADAALTCLLQHVAPGSCAEPLWLAGAATTLFGAAFWYRLRQLRTAAATPPSAYHPASERRLDRLCSADRRLSHHRARIVMIGGDDARTVGLLSPRIEIGQDALERLDDGAVIAALLHEFEHARARDPLRNLIAMVTQAINPLGFLLAPELARWRAARELVCDRAAIARGAEPLCLAQALVALARPRPAPQMVAHLCGGGALALLRLRVALLFSYAKRAPRVRKSSSLWWGALAAGLLVAAPHSFDAWPLGVLHSTAERVVLPWGP